MKRAYILVSPHPSTWRTVLVVSNWSACKSLIATSNWIHSTCVCLIPYHSHSNCSLTCTNFKRLYPFLFILFLFLFLSLFIIIITTQTDPKKFVISPSLQYAEQTHMAEENFDLRADLIFCLCFSLFILFPYASFSRRQS